MELKQYFAVVKKWWWLIAVSVLVATVSSYLAVSRVPRIYQATTTAIVGPQGSYFDLAEERRAREMALKVVNLASRHPILEGVAEALELPFVPAVENVSARVVPGTAFLEISVRDTDPERARIIADEIVRQLIIQTAPEDEEQQSHRAFAEAQLAELEQSIETTKEEIEAKKAKQVEAKSARTIQELQSDIDALQSILTQQISNYTSLLQTVQEESNYISIFEPAVTPSRPISPHVMETILMAAAIGLALALGGAFLIEFLDDTVKTPSDVARIVDLTTLGVIAQIEGREYEEKLIPVEQPRSAIAEAYRTLRTNIQVSSIDEPIRTLMVTSPNPREGKSTTAANLGVVLAQTGKSVVLVDSDLRRSTLHKIFQTPNQAGLTDALLQEEPVLDGLLQDTEIQNLRVMTSGPLPPNPSELLGSQKMCRLIESLEKEADIVIFDAPPTLPVTDAAVLALQMDGTLLVIEAGRTRRAAARQAVENLRQVGANVLGATLNRLSPRDVKGYYYYYAEDSGVHRRRRARRWYQRIPLLGNLFSH